MIGNAVKTVTATYTIKPDDSTILCDGTSAAFTVTLPPAKYLGTKDTLCFTIIKLDSSGNAITLGVSGSDTIIGSSTFTGIVDQYDMAMLQSDGVSIWYIISSSPGL
jgi:hypothetical protein